MNMVIVVSLPSFPYRHVVHAAYHYSSGSQRMQVAALAIGVVNPSEGRIG
jgi:hypothetical protein